MRKILVDELAINVTLQGALDASTTSPVSLAATSAVNGDGQQVLPASTGTTAGNVVFMELLVDPEMFRKVEEAVMKVCGGG
jgi:hypothetical protein